MKGDVPEATQMVMDLRENYHIFCSIVVYPVIPKEILYTASFPLPHIVLKM
jgi:glycine C-acetyltransferase